VKIGCAGTNTNQKRGGQWKETGSGTRQGTLSQHDRRKERQMGKPQAAGTHRAECDG